jgi:hypothetical protein
MDSVKEVSAPEQRTPTGWHKYWQREKNAADKRLRECHNQGNKVVRRYTDERDSGKESIKVRLNLFHQNATTLESMMYGNTPKVEVTREHQDPDDDEARVASYLFQRLLEAECKSTEVLKCSLQDRLIPGMGVARVRYGYDTTSITSIQGEDIEKITYEYAPVEYVHWQDFLWGWCRSWDEMPWIGFRVWLEEEDAKERFGEKIAKNLEYKAFHPFGTEEQGEQVDSDQKTHTQKAEIWEFWHKKEGKVFWFSDGADIILDMKDDPLGLDDFWPIPRPLMANITTTNFIPVADFIINQDLYNEIDILQTRISIITEAIKVVGVYDQSAGSSVGRMLKEGVENDLIPVDNWAMFAEKGGLKGSVDWFPVETITAVLQTLTQIQQNKMQQLYEVTGMSDLMRGGNTDQYTGVGTQQMKAKLGSIQIQALQDEFARFASDLLALKAEIISKHYLPQSIIQQSNAEFIPNADKPLLGPALKLMQSPQAKWRIDIRPESIAMVDYAQLKNDRVEYLTAMSTFIQSAQAMVKQVPNSMPILLEFMKFGLAGFKGADYLEGMLDQAIDLAQKAPPQGQDDGGQKEAQLEQMRHQLKVQENQQKFQQDMQREQMKTQSAMALETTDHQNKMEFEQFNQQGAMKEMMTEFKMEMQKLRDELRADLERERAQSAYAIQERNVEHGHTMREIQANDTGGE